jgi:hypothetical protein
MMDGLFGNLSFHGERSKKMIPISFNNTPYWFILTMIPWFFCQLIVDTNPSVAVVLALLMSGFLCAIKKGQELVFFDKVTLLYFSLLAIVTIPDQLMIDEAVCFDGDFSGLYIQDDSFNSRLYAFFSG